jgi:hypothetical protein
MYIRYVDTRSYQQYGIRNIILSWTTVKNLLWLKRSNMETAVMGESLLTTILNLMAFAYLPPPTT